MALVKVLDAYYTNFSREMTGETQNRSTSYY